MFLTWLTDVTVYRIVADALTGARPAPITAQEGREGSRAQQVAIDEDLRSSASDGRGAATAHKSHVHKWHTHTHTP